MNDMHFEIVGIVYNYMIKNRNWHWNNSYSITEINCKLYANDTAKLFIISNDCFTTYLNYIYQMKLYKRVKRALISFANSNCPDDNARRRLMRALAIRLQNICIM